MPTIVRRTFLTGFVALMAAACGGDGEAEGDRYDRPSGAQDRISDEELAYLEEVGAEIHGGLNPPELAGAYDRAGGVVFYHDRREIEGTELCYDIWTVEPTDRADVYRTSSENYNNCSGTAEGAGSYISGRDGCFTLYSATTGERDGCEYTGVGITSGCVTDEGIENMLVAGLAGPRLSREPGACEALINAGLLGAEGEREILDRGFVERID
jgi:hypothetical protein